MAQSFIYEQSYRLTGWYDDAGLSKAAWWDQDIVDPVIPLYTAVVTSMFIDPDTFYVTPPITIEVFPAIYEDPDEFYRPMSARALRQSAQMLKNEIRRTR